MKYIFWNVRGIANSPTKLALKRLLIAYKPEFCFISEPWMKFTDFPPNWFSRLNLKQFAVNNRSNLLPNLWCFGSSNIDLVVVHVDDQQVSFTVKENGVDIGISVVYASTNYVKRRQLWFLKRFL
jgi:hypothetical protein